jgi:hypothetical protein
MGERGGRRKGNFRVKNRLRYAVYAVDRREEER